MIDDRTKRRIGIGAWLFAAALWTTAVVVGLSCSSPATAPEAPPLADAIGARTRAASVEGLPSHAQLPRLQIVSKCTLAKGSRWPSGELASGDLHPQGFGGDPFVWRDPTGQWRMLMNFPRYDAEEGRWPTSISWTTSEDGIFWQPPQPLISPTKVRGRKVIQHETPAYLRHPMGHIVATLSYQYDAIGNRRDTVQLWRGESWDGPYEPMGDPLLPTMRLWEAPYTARWGTTAGGCQEPSLLIAGPWLIVPYGAVTYQGSEIKPSVALAGTATQGREWTRWPDPILTANGAQGGAGQPQCHADPRGGFHLLWTERYGLTDYRVMHAWSAGNLSQWHRFPDPLFTTADHPDFAARINAPCLVIQDGGQRRKLSVYFFGSKDPRFAGQQSPPTYVGVARAAQEVGL